MGRSVGLGLVPRASTIMFLLFGFFHKENVFVYYLCNYNLGLTGKMCLASAGS